MVMSEKKRIQYEKLINRRIEEPNFFDVFFGGDEIILQKIFDDGYADLLVDDETGHIKIQGSDMVNKIYYLYFKNILDNMDISNASLKMFKTFSPFFTDVIEQNGRLYLIIDGEEMPNFFSKSSGRYDSSHDLVNTHYVGDVDYNAFDYFPSFNDYYSHIIDDLNTENLNKLHNYMVNHEGGVIPVNNESPDELVELAEEQGHTDSVVLSKNILEQLDVDTFTYILKTYFDEIYHDLGWRHNDANNDAWISDVHDTIESELTRIFDHPIKRELIKKRSYNGQDYYREVFVVDITEKFVEIIMNFLKQNYDSSYNDDMLDYWGNFTGLYQEYLDRYENLLKVYTPDYPNYSKVTEIFNELFSDII